MLSLSVWTQCHRPWEKFSVVWRRSSCISATRVNHKFEVRYPYMTRTWPLVTRVQGSTSQSSDQLSSWADHASKFSTYVTQFNLPTTKPAVLQKPVIRGNRQMTGCAIKTVQRLLRCFVGRLDKDTSEVELHDYLSSVGNHDASCKKLESEDGRIFRTVAFRVSCKAEFRALFYNEDTWPAGAELREMGFL